MFADYNGRQYEIIREEGKWNLISMNPDSEKYGFEKDEDINYK